MAISLDATSSKDAGNVSSTTLSHTCAADATMLVVCIGADSAAAPTSVTYNGSAMTKEATATGLNTTIWTLANPSTGANNISVTFATNHYFAISALSLKGTAVASYTDGTNTGSGSTNSASLSITTTAANDWIVMAGTHNRNSSRTAITNSTIQVDQYVTTDNFRVLGITRSTTTAGSYSTGWDMGTPSDGWWAVAVAIKEGSSSLSVSVSDQLNITESVTMLRISNISVSDQLNITESVSMLAILNISVSDAITITESLTINGGSFAISVADDITITESVSILITFLNIDVSDQLTITESVSAALAIDVSVSDSIAVSESVSMTIALSLSVYDSITITENNTMLVDVNISVSDAITITESFSGEVSAPVVGFAILRGRDQDLPITLTAQEYPLGFKDQAQM